MSIVDCRLPNEDGQPRIGYAHLAGLGAVLLALFLLCDAKMWRPGELFTIRDNIQIAEAQAWWEGRLDLPERKWDSALFEGRVYSHFPPMFSFLSALIVPFADGFPHGLILLVVVLPVPILGYVLFARLTRSSSCGALLAIGLVCGTSVLPVLDKTLRGGAPYPVNQALALIGSLLFLIEYFGRRRVWLLGVGLAVAAWSRQITGVLAVPMLWAAWTVPSAGKIRVRGCAIALVLLVAVAPMVLNTAKFKNPLDSGYMYLYADRPEDAFSRDARAHGLFSTHFVPRNLYYTNVGLPETHRVRIEGADQVFLQPNEMGTGIWWTTPLLLWVLFDFRRILRNQDLAVLFLAALLANLALMFYHSTGYQQRGFNRYSLDYLPVLMALVAPGAVAGRRAWISSAMVAWSVFYFAVMIRWPHVRVW